MPPHQSPPKPTPPKPTPEKVKEEIERDEETVSRLVGRKGQKGRKEREDKSGRTLQRESAAAKADDVGEGEEEEEGRRRHFQQVRMSKIKGWVEAGRRQASLSFCEKCVTRVCRPKHKAPHNSP